MLMYATNRLATAENSVFFGAVDSTTEFDDGETEG